MIGICPDLPRPSEPLSSVSFATQNMSRFDTPATVDTAPRKLE